MAYNTPQKSLALLAEQMQGENSIHDYDVLVSYNQAELNKILLQRAEEVGTPTSEGLKWSENTKDDFDEEFTNTVEVILGKPSLQILDHEGNITFSTPFTGSNAITRKRDGKTKTTKFENVKVVITSSLAAIQGTTNAAGKFTPKSSPEPSRAGAVKVIEPGKDVSLGICIDFPSLLSVDINNDGQGGNTADQLDRLTNLVKAKIERRFKEAGFQYCLAGLNNETPKDRGSSIVLQPARFTFSVVHGDINTSAVCMGVLLQDNPNAGDNPPSIQFAPNGKVVNPIPTGRTASVIFSHRVMASLFIVPGLSKAVTNAKCVSQKGDAGMRFKLNLPSNVIKADRYSQRGGVISGVDFDMGGFSFNLNDPASELTISPTNSTSTPPVTLSYKSPTQKMGWAYHVRAPETPTYVEGGSVNADFSFTGTAVWGQGPDPKKHPNQLQLLFTFPSRLGVTIQPQKYAWWEQMVGARDTLPPHARGIHPEAPKISIDMSPMDYFLTTNLLFPGEHIFQVDDPGQTTDAQGIMTPRDTILTGTIKRGSV